MENVAKTKSHIYFLAVVIIVITALTASLITYDKPSTALSRAEAQLGSNKQITLADFISILSSSSNDTNASYKVSYIGQGKFTVSAENQSVTAIFPIKLGILKNNSLFNGTFQFTFPQSLAFQGGNGARENVSITILRNGTTQGYTICSATSTGGTYANGASTCNSSVINSFNFTALMNGINLTVSSMKGMTYENASCGQFNLSAGGDLARLNKFIDGNTGLPHAPTAPPFQFSNANGTASVCLNSSAQSVLPVSLSINASVGLFDKGSTPSNITVGVQFTINETSMNRSLNAVPSG